MKKKILYRIKTVPSTLPIFVCYLPSSLWLKSLIVKEMVSTRDVTAYLQVTFAKRSQWYLWGVTVFFPAKKYFANIKVQFLSQEIQQNPAMKQLKNCCCLFVLGLFVCLLICLFFVCLSVCLFPFLCLFFLALFALFTGLFCMVWFFMVDSLYIIIFKLLLKHQTNDKIVSTLLCVLSSFLLFYLSRNGV